MGSDVIVSYREVKAVFGFLLRVFCFHTAAGFPSQGAKVIEDI